MDEQRLVAANDRALVIQSVAAEQEAHRGIALTTCSREATVTP
jgi:hypothetical protein